VLFNAPKTDLSGQAFKLVFTVSTKPDTLIVQDADSVDALGGSSYGRSSFISACFEVMGVVDCGYGNRTSATGKSFSATSQGFYASAEQDSTDDLGRDVYKWFYLGGGTNDLDIFSTLSLEENFTYSTHGLADMHGSIRDYRSDPTTGQVTSYLGTGFSGVTINVVAVPEPATWALMLVGFGAIGVALRRGSTLRRACG
jgi:hypothetical protein